MKREIMNVQELIKYGIEQLKCNKIDDEIIKAKALLKYILNVNDTYLIIHSNEMQSIETEEKYKNLIKRLIGGSPLQYITHKQEFMNLNFYVDENVLIPQPDTEILVQEAIKIIKQYNNKVKILDLCTGSGAIAVSIADVFKNQDIQVYASDISSKAIEVAKKNAKQNKVQVNFIESNMFENIKEEKFDVIVSNPPYIETNVISKLAKDVQNEPHIALDGGEDGLKYYRVIANNYENILKTGGMLLLEIGYNQRKSVINLFKNKKVECIKDLSENDRIIIVK